MSRRGDEFVEFGARVLEHIDTYTVPQYGDAPDDSVERWSADDCMKQIWKYVMRFGKNQRGQVEQEKDILKIAHYAGMVYWKMKREGKDGTGI